MTKKSGNKQTQLPKRTIIWRALFCVGSLLLASGFCFLISDRLITLLQTPLGQNLFYGTANSLSVVTLITSLGFGLAVTLPVIVYQMVRLLAPDSISQGRALFYGSLSLLLALGGLTFSYFIVLPAAIEVFSSAHSGASISSLVGISDYFIFTSVYLLTAAVICQTPIFLASLNQALKLSARKFLNLEGYVFFASLVPAAILTPTTNLTTQLLAAGLLVIPYQIGLVWVALSKHQTAVTQPGKLIDPFHLAIPDQALQAVTDFGSPVHIHNPIKDLAPQPRPKPVNKSVPKASSIVSKLPAAPVQTTKKTTATPGLSRYKGVGYARQPASYKARPKRALISDFT